MESACLCLPKAELIEILRPEYFKGNEVWAIYPPNIYDLFDGPDEVRDFIVGFIANRSKNMSSLCSMMMLSCVLFRPSLMSEADFKVLKKGIAYFESNYLRFQCGGIKNLIP